MLNVVTPRVLRSVVGLFSREFRSVRPRPVTTRPVVLLEDIIADVHSSGADLKGGKGCASKKDITNVHHDKSASSSLPRAVAKLCSKSCSGCPRSAANSKSKSRVEEQLHAQKVKEEKGEERGRVHGSTLLDDSFVDRVSRVIDARFRTR